VAKQIPLDLPHVPAMTREDFLVTGANRAAMAMIDQWPAWPSHGAIICGPAGSGKSHLAHIWQGMANADSVAAKNLSRGNVPTALSKGSIVVESVDEEAIDEAALFHLLNLVRQNKTFVLLTSRVPPQDIALTLPDLRSRLASLPVVNIAAPDDALLRGVLVKHFSDRQIAVDEALINYLLARMPRSLGMARDLVARIDAEALTEKAEITRAFAGRILAQMTSPDLL
jgi:chromosomal replication initiation ATPase DnaA